MEAEFCADDGMNGSASILACCVWRICEIFVKCIVLNICKLFLFCKLLGYYRWKRAIWETHPGRKLGVYSFIFVWCLFPCAHRSEHTSQYLKNWRMHCMMQFGYVNRWQLVRSRRVKTVKVSGTDFGTQACRYSTGIRPSVSFPREWFCFYVCPSIISQVIALINGYTFL